MKKIIISSSIILIIGLTAFAQTETFKEWGYRIEYDPAPSFSKDLRFSVHGRYSRPAKKVHGLSGGFPGFLRFLL